MKFIVVKPKEFQIFHFKKKKKSILWLFFFYCNSWNDQNMKMQNVLQNVFSC